jgi:hypothetical protein
MSDDAAETAEPRRTRLLRVAAHVRTQNWTAIGIDFLIVVLGVFVGIQVANWNADRQQAALQTSYLERLRFDFIGVRERTQQHVAFYRDSIDGGELILTLIHADEAALRDMTIDRARMAIALDSLAQTRNVPQLPATYVEMRSNGQLSRIANPALRDRLADYDRYHGVSLELMRLVGDNAVRQTPVLLRHFRSRTVADPTQLSGIREELIDYDLAAMRADPEFEVAVRTLRRWAFNSLPHRERKLAMIDEIVTLIEAELEASP